MNNIDGFVCPLCNSGETDVEFNHKGVRLIRCCQCTLVYSWPLHVPEGLYDAAYGEEGNYQYYLEGNDPQFRANRLHTPWPIRRFLAHIKPEGRLLDIGCSTGKFLLLAKKAGWKPCGVEVSEKAATIASELTHSEIYIGTVEDMDVTNTFEAITTWEVLEHVPNPIEFIISAIGLLRSGGHLALSVPNWKSPWIKHSAAQEHWPPYHLTFWERESLLLLLQKAGLADIVIWEKPFAWGEEVGRWKWLYLPIALIRSYLLDQKGMHLVAIARKP